MGTNSISFSLTFLCSLLLILHPPQRSVVVQVVAQEVAKSESEALGVPEKRETLEIIIGGGGSPSPSPSPETPCPPPPPALSPRLIKARKVLLKFKSLIDDPDCYTKNWLPNESPCQYNGIRCADFPKDNERAVAGIDLNRARIAGKNGCLFPLESSGVLGDIEELTFFHVNSNNFTGSLSRNVLNFQYFFELDLSNNKISSAFPDEVLQATQLVFLDLRFNQLQGTIPSKLFEKDLDVIFVNNNKFTGCLPENFGSTPARYLTFANNQLTGQIPKSIGYGNTSKSLTEVLFLGNKFDGCLPYEIGNLKKVVVFDVSKNLLTGPIPLSFGCLNKIQFLNLAHNKFYGCVPDNLCQIPSLRKNGNLSLSDNYFNEVGPSCWSLIKSKVLDVSRNCIPGLPNQRSHQECYEFYHKEKKPCPNPASLNFIPCKGYWQGQGQEQEQEQKQSTSNVPEATGSPPEPVIYKTLKPHRLRL
ncbi:hypothetical protein RJT34_02426 [Clitoria ternatea]|uniref:Cell wall hydroxyproline-rich glycoprotein n=1 Tax=Clitoria ternatea TaxID=43366 RepID=A0AAN9Q3X0_CLITE